MASIRKKGKGYEVRVTNGYDSQGRVRTISRMFMPKETWSEKKALIEANKFATSLENKIACGQSMSADKLSLKKLSDLFLEDMKPPELARTTYVSYRDIIQRRLIPYLGTIKITQINGHTATEYSRLLHDPKLYEDEQSKPLSDGTIRKDLAVLSAMLSYAVSQGYITINPLIYAKKRSNRRKPTEEYKVEYFSIEQAKWFLWALDHPIDIRHKAHESTMKNGLTYSTPEYTQRWKLPLKWRFCFQLFLFTGDRRGENLALTWEDLDFEKCTIHIDKASARADGETFQKSTKTYKRRTVVVPGFVMDVARLYLAEQKRQCLNMGDRWEGYRGEDFKKNFLFIQQNGRQMDLGSPRQQFKRLIRIFNQNVASTEEEKLPETATLHDLRHTAASILISNNMDPRSVAGVLGHANPSTTLNIYAYFFKKKSQEAADIMETVLTSIPENSMVVGK